MYNFHLNPSVLIKLNFCVCQGVSKAFRERNVQFKTGTEKPEFMEMTRSQPLGQQIKELNSAYGLISEACALAKWLDQKVTTSFFKLSLLRQFPFGLLVRNFHIESVSSVTFYFPLINWLEMGV